MKIVLQRVSKAVVLIANKQQANIGQGFLLLLGIGHHDTEEDISWLVRKVTGLRVFSDENGKMNLDIDAIKGSIIVVSQFTLHANIKKGNRPSYIEAAKPEIAIPLYEKFVQQLKNATQLDVQTGIFAADMKIELVNDGPVTIILDSKNKG